MRKISYYIILVCLCNIISQVGAQSFKHLRKGVPAARKPYQYNNIYNIYTTDTLGNLYVCVMDEVKYGYGTDNGIVRCHIETWNGTLWLKTPSVKLFNLHEWNNDIYPPYVQSMIIYDGMVVIAGQFDSIENNMGRDIIAWDGLSWTTIGNGTLRSASWQRNYSVARINTIKCSLLEYKNKLILIGNFDSVPGARVNGITQLNSSYQWENLGAQAGNTPFALFQGAGVINGINVPNTVKAIDSLYFFPASAYPSVSQAQQAFNLNGQTGSLLYASNGKTYQPVSTPPGFMITRVFEQNGRLALLGYPDTNKYYTNLWAVRDKLGTWNIQQLPYEDSLSVSDYTPTINAQGGYLKGSNFVLGCFTAGYKGNSYSFYEHDGKTLTGSRKFSKMLWGTNIYPAGKKTYLCGDFYHLTNYNTGVTDSFANNAVEIVNNKTIVIQGRAFVDWNLDGIWQSYEPPLKNKMVYWKDSGYATATNEKGYYTLYLPVGNNREIKTNMNRYYVPAWSGTPVFSSNNDTTIIWDFPYDVTLDRDLSVELSAYRGSRVRRGSTASYIIKVSNVSGKPVKNPKVVLKLNPRIKNFNARNGSPSYNASARTATWALNYTIAPDSFIYLHFSADYSQDSFVMGDTVFTTVHVLNTFNDADTLNNKDTLMQRVVSAYDPNMKQSYPEGPVTHKLDKIKFTVHFQNEGTDTAVRVVVVDTLQAIMPMYEIEIGTSSHPFSFSVENNIMTWEFDNIMLPTKKEDEQGSMGYLTFFAKVNPKIRIGDTIRNRAGIYFDYEKPVLTNYASTVMVKRQDVTVHQLQENLTGLEVFPNPTQGMLTVKNSLTTDNIIKIYDLTGRLLYESGLSPSEERQININNWNAGVYLLVSKQGGTLRILKQ